MEITLIFSLIQVSSLTRESNLSTKWKHILRKMGMDSIAIFIITFFISEAGQFLLSLWVFLCHISEKSI